MSFTCPDCHRTSHHPQDEKNAYCGNCHQFKAESWMQPRCLQPDCPGFGSREFDGCTDPAVHATPPAWRTT